MKQLKRSSTKNVFAILAIGDELFFDRQDTNSPSIQEILLGAGIETGIRIVVPDDETVMVRTLKQLMKQYAGIICCGGLGPTLDDRTRFAISKATGVPLREHQGTVKKLQNYFRKRKIVMPTSNLQQAMIPQHSKVLENDFGTAPGFLLHAPETIIAALPGPPFECLPMLQQKLLPWLPMTKKLGKRMRTIRVCGFAESQLQERVTPILKTEPGIQLGFLLDTPGEILIKLRATSDNQKIATQQLLRATKKVTQVIGEQVVDVYGKSLPEVIGRLLKNYKQTLATAESCTGGLIASRLTAIPGCSVYYLEGAITYSNQAKQKRLGVTSQVLLHEGAVSRSVALQMAKGIKKKSQTDWGLAITGIAGPGGGSKVKPVGRVYVAVVGPQQQDVIKLQLPGTRDRIQAASASLALDLLRRQLKNQSIQYQ